MKKLRIAFWYFVWQYAPTSGLRSLGWYHWLGASFLKPAPRVNPRYRPEDETGVDDPRLAA